MESELIRQIRAIRVFQSFFVRRFPCFLFVKISSIRAIRVYQVS